MLLCNCSLSFMGMLSIIEIYRCNAFMIQTVVYNTAFEYEKLAIWEKKYKGPAISKMLEVDTEIAISKILEVYKEIDTN